MLPSLGHRSLRLAVAVLLANAPLAAAQAPTSPAAPVSAAPTTPPVLALGRDDPRCSETDPDTQKRTRCLAERVLRGTIARESQAVYPFALAGTMPTSVKLLAGTENKTASLTWSIPVHPLASLAFTASAPLSESDPRTSIVQLSELANKGKVGGQLNWGIQRRPTDERAGQILTKLQDACTKARAKTTHTAPEAGISEEGCDLTTLAGVDPVVREYLAEYHRTAWFASLKGEVGRQTFEFVNESTFADADDTKHPASGAVMFGALFAPSNVFASLGVRFENGYKDADSQAVCGPPHTGESQACPVKVVGGPANPRRGVLELEIRKFLPTKAKYPIGVSALFRRDWRQDETSIEIPAYLVKDKDGGLSGGVSVGYVWSPKANVGGARFAVFVGQTFGLVPTGD